MFLHWEVIGNKYIIAGGKWYTLYRKASAETKVTFLHSEVLTNILKCKIL